MEADAKRNTVLIVGGGLSGLTAAHVLTKRGFAVTVLEASADIGGKLRSWTDARYDVPMEHGYRVYAEFYVNLFEILREIPDGRSRTVFDNLQAAFDPVLPLGPMRARELLRLLLLACASEERWDAALSTLSIDDALPEPRSPGARKLVRNLEEVFATNKNTNFLRDLVVLSARGVTRTVRMYRMSGPTSEVFVAPWVRHLGQRGVRFLVSRCLRRIETRAGAVHRLVVSGPEGDEVHRADHYIVAVPAYCWRDISCDVPLPEVERAVRNIRYVAQNGVCLYLNRRLHSLPMAFQSGVRSVKANPWKLSWFLTNDSHWQRDFRRFGRKDIRSIVSYCISDWETPGAFVGKPALQCTPSEIIEEVIRCSLEQQLFARDDVVCLDPERGVYGLIDEAVRFDPQSGIVASIASRSVATNHLSWADTADTQSSLDNLFLASTWCDQHGFLSGETMEGACITGKLAANALLRRIADQASSGTADLSCVYKCHPYSPGFFNHLPFAKDPLRWLALETLHYLGRADAALLRHWPVLAAGRVDNAKA